MFSCLWWIFLPQIYLLFIWTMMPASVSRCSPCFFITGGSKGSSPLYLLLSTLQCTDFLLPCSQLRRNHVLFCQSHPSGPHFTGHRSPSFSDNTHAMFFCSLCAFLSSWKVSSASSKSQYFSAHVSPVDPRCPRNGMLTVSASVPKCSAWGVGAAASHFTGRESLGQKTQLV